MSSGGVVMIRESYICEFLSDVVLPASANTQGDIRLNDSIPGSNFLGIVAQAYDEIEQSFAIFHGGAVYFGDATLSIDGKKSYKVPLSFHKVKLADECFNRLHLTDEEERAFRSQHKQLKQMRSGYITEAFRIKTPAYSYAQKSSYDKEARRSKDEGMYGYSALRKGSKWIFEISYEDAKFKEIVERHLLGKKRLGKSKTSQYGQVSIKPYSTATRPQTFTPQSGYTYLYVNSRLSLIDETGALTTEITPKNLGLSDGEIVWEKTFIRTGHYTPFNYQRQTFDATRSFIEKGSVITLKNRNESIPSKIGAFINEGFGDILINPVFLASKEILFDKKESEKPSKEAIEGYDKRLIAFLESKEEKERLRFAIAEEVQAVYKELVGPSKSQWGEIRSFAAVAKDKDTLITKIKSYMAKKQWEGKRERLLDAIDSSKSPLEFTKLLAMIVAKYTKGGKDGN